MKTLKLKSKLTNEIRETLKALHKLQRFIV